MLTQPEFEALLDRYLAGNSRPGEHRLVARWYQQFRQAEASLNEAEQRAARAAIWARMLPGLATPEPEGE